MKIAKLGDVHTGVRNGNADFRAFIKNYLINYFLPKCVEEGVELIIQYGDFFDVRKSLYGLDKEWIEKEYIPACKEAGIPWWFILGNHDIQLRHSNRSHHLSLFTEIAPELFTVYDKPTEVEIDGDTHLMLPWINEQGFEGSNYDECLKAVKDSTARYCHGHLELSGFQLNKAAIAEHGTIDEALFDKFEQTDTGHYHCRSERRGIRYIGTPYHLTWIDVGDSRGFEIWDSETKENRFIENDPSLSLFSIVKYDYDSIKDDDGVLKALTDVDRMKDALGGRIVKIHVVNRDNTRHFNSFVSAVRRAGCIDYDFIDETVTQVQKVEVDEASLHLDTANTLVEFIYEQDLGVDKTELSNYAVALYGETEE